VRWQGRRCGATALAALLVTGFLAAGCLAGAAGASPASAPVHHRRLLILSLPGVTWQELGGTRLPHLERLFASSAMGDLTNRTADGPASLISGYATIGAGSRAAAGSSTADTAYEVTEPYGSGTAGEEFTRRTGTADPRGIVYLGLSSIESANRSQLFGAELGAFGDALAHAGMHRAVIGNADGPTPNPGVVVQNDRALAIALLGSAGTVPGGAVSDSLLQPDVHAPYATRLDPQAVVGEFTSVWRDNSAVLVEASDLERADTYGQFTTGAQHARLRQEALQQTDRLVGRLLHQVDLARDIVLVVSPSHPSGPSALGIAALHAPGVRGGYLRSPTMRRGGFVALVDVAPTALDRLGIDRPSSMEGRPMVVRGSSTDYADRRSTLARYDIDGRFRDRLVDTMQTTLAVIGVLLAAAAVLLVVTRGGRDSRHRRLISAGALCALALPTVTYLSAPLHFASHGGVGAYSAFLVVGTLLLGAVYVVVDRATRVSGVEAALGVIVALHLLDAVTGAHVEFNTPLGYSATVGIRVAGLGNPTFAQLASAAVLLAGMFVVRDLRRGRRRAVALLTVTFIVLAAPFFGQSFGAALSTAPAFLVFGWLVYGRRLRPRHLAALAGVVVVIGLLVGFVDLLRPGSDQTHIGLFFQRVGGQGSGDFFTVIHRKLNENFASFSTRAWVVLALVGLTTLAWLVASGRLERALAWPQEAWRATVGSLVVLLVLGYAFKDSGIAVPAVMTYVVLATVTALLARAAPQPATAGAPVTVDAGSASDPRPGEVQDAVVDGIAL